MSDKKKVDSKEESKEEVKEGLSACTLEFVDDVAIITCPDAKSVGEASVIVAKGIQIVQVGTKIIPIVKQEVEL